MIVYPDKFPDLSKFLNRFDKLEEQINEEEDVLAQEDPKTEREKAVAVNSLETEGIENTSSPNAIQGIKLPQLPENRDIIGDEDYDGPNFGGMLGTKGDISGGVMSGLGAAKDISMNLSTTAASDEQALAQGVGTTFNLAKTGFQLAGPYGAAGGVAAGIGLTAYDMLNDRNKRAEESFNRYKDEIAAKSKTRANNFHLNKTKGEIEALKDVNKRNLLNPINTSRYGRIS